MKQTSPLLRAVIFALVIGLGVYFGLGMFFKPKSGNEFAQQAPEVKVVKILKTKRDMKRGATASSSDFKWVQVAEAELNAATEVGVYRDDNNPGVEFELEGYSAVKNVEANRYVTPNMFKNLGNRSAAKIRPGFRLVALPVSAESAASGTILPNDYVDILLTEKDRSRKDETGDSRSALVGNGNLFNGSSDKLIQTRATSYMLLENVRVVAIDQSMSGEGGGSSFMTDTAQNAGQALDSLGFVGSTAAIEVPRQAVPLLANARRLETGGDSFSFTLALRGVLESGESGGGVRYYPNALDLVSNASSNNITLHHLGKQKQLMTGGNTGSILQNNQSTLSQAIRIGSGDDIEQQMPSQPLTAPALQEENSAGSAIIIENDVQLSEGAITIPNGVSIENPAQPSVQQPQSNGQPRVVTPTYNSNDDFESFDQNDILRLTPEQSSNLEQEGSLQEQGFAQTMPSQEGTYSEEMSIDQEISLEDEGGFNVEFQ